MVACVVEARARVVLVVGGLSSLSGRRGRDAANSRGGAAVLFVEHQAAAFDKGEGWKRRHGLVVMGWVGHSDGDNGEQRGEEVDVKACVCWAFVRGGMI